ncbi:uncharacterized protein RJT21DRAFT_116643 [Scheffersomyces amazonensis]|uniref:uncharacterized protein n=1 Tax=Scheffersomyces amazonensis TaxID=1078765 RepID=UPI00315DFD0A
MNIQRLKNLWSIRTKNISKRIQQALEELAEGLSGNNPSPQVQPQPIAIPVRNSGRSRFPVQQRNFQRYFGSFSGFNTNFTTGGAGSPWSFHKFKSPFLKPRLMFKFYNTHNTGGGSTSKILKLLNRKTSSSLFHNFSQTYQSSFRAKWSNANVRLTYRSVFFNLKEKYQIGNDDVQGNKFRPSIALNLSLNADHHQLTLKLAKTDSSATYQEKLVSNQVNHGCYMDFPINFNLSIPDETILNEEILEEVMFNIKMFERKLKELKQDLHNLFDLGELPIKHISSKNVLRVYFPNCDKAKLESLCKEKNIMGGIIFEDITDQDGNAYPHYESTSMSDVIPDSNEASSTVTANDILSSYYGSNSTNSSVSDFDNELEEDVLSSSIIHPISDDQIVRLDDMVVDEPPQWQVQVPQMQHININDYDDFYWVSPA